jgi:hypothetical protein
MRTGHHVIVAERHACTDDGRLMTNARVKGAWYFSSLEKARSFFFEFPYPQHSAIRLEPRLSTQFHLQFTLKDLQWPLRLLIFDEALHSSTYGNRHHSRDSRPIDQPRYAPWNNHVSKASRTRGRPETDLDVI